MLSEIGSGNYLVIWIICDKSHITLQLLDNSELKITGHMSLVILGTENLGTDYSVEITDIELLTAEQLPYMASL